MKLKKILAGAVAAAMAVTSLGTFASAEAFEKGVFFLTFSDADWKVSAWGRDDVNGSIDISDYETTAKLEGNGTYTVAVDLSKGYTNPSYLDDETNELIEYTTGNGIGFMAVHINGDYPTLGVDIKSVAIDGNDQALTGVSFTLDEDGGRRTNIYNQWIGFSPSREGDISKDPDNASGTLIDISSLGEWSKIEVTFEVYGLDDDAAGDDDVPAPPEYEYKVLEDGTVAITKYNGSDEKVVIPDEIYGMAVTQINGAFSGCKSLTEIIIPDSVTEIGSRAFFDCESLTEIVIPDSVTEIGGWAFYNCESLTEIVIPDSVTTIGDSAFRRCTSITKIVIPDGVTTIEADTFEGCDSLTEIVIPDSVTVIGNQAFYDCESLTEIVIPDNVTTIGFEAFSYCESLAEIVIPDSVTTIGDGAFYSCYSLTEIVIPDSVTEIGEEAFVECTSLTSIVVKENNASYVSIDGVLFDKNVTTLIQYPIGRQNAEYTIPDSVTLIGEWAFSFCTSLTEIVIPDSLTTIGAYAFWWCYSLTEIVIPDSVKTIGNYAFWRCYSLTKIVIPDNVTWIGDDAFYACADSFTVYGYAGSYAETYAKENDINFVAIEALKDEETKIQITAPAGVLPADAELNVKELESDEETQSIIFDITLTDLDGEETQPTGSVTVRIPVPDGWDTSEINVYHRDKDGKLTDMNAYCSGGYIVFTTDHFSEYIITTEKLITVTVGDVNSDGDINDLDVVQLARYLAGWNVTVDQSAADVDGNGKVDDLDVVMLARRLAGWNV